MEDMHQTYKEYPNFEKMETETENESSAIFINSTWESQTLRGEGSEFESNIKTRQIENIFSI